MSNLKHYRERRSQDRRSRLHIMGGASISDHKQPSEATPPALWATRHASAQPRIKKSTHRQWGRSVSLR